MGKDKKKAAKLKVDVKKSDGGRKSPEKERNPTQFVYVLPPIPIITIPVSIKLTFETVPGPLHGRSLRNLLPSDVWDIIRRKCYRLAGWKCEICGDNGKNQGRDWPVECHEKWAYDDVNLVQRLAGFIALCPRCHLCKHPGYADLNGLKDEMWAHFYKVNGPRTPEMEQYLIDEGRVFHARSLNKGWVWDVGYASEYAGVDVAPKEFVRPVYDREVKFKTA